MLKVTGSVFTIRSDEVRREFPCGFKSPFVLLSFFSVIKFPDKSGVGERGLFPPPAPGHHCEEVKAGT